MMKAIMFENMRKFKVNLNDELWPQIKTGHRHVVAKVGWKWVYVKENPHITTKQWKKITRKTWDRISKEEIHA